MVKKMKLKFSFAILLACILPLKVNATDKPLAAEGVFRCGSNLSTSTFAYKDEHGAWKGFDADICRAFAWAIYGTGDKFEMVDVRAHDIGNALSSGKIDIMLSNNVNPATVEAKQKGSEVGLLYYDRQMFAAKDMQEDATSMEAFKGKKVCVFATADNFTELKKYNKQYDLNLRILPYKSLRKARNAFLLKRCELFSMQGLVLQNIISDSPGKNLTMLPEEFSPKPVYAYVAANNNKLRVTAKWVLNALYKAEELGMNKENARKYAFEDNAENLKLFGEKNLLWKTMQVRPDWLRLAVDDVGNMKDIFERNLGSQSKYKMQRGKGALINDGGVVSTEPFK